jgi:hypothetical protein
MDAWVWIVIAIAVVVIIAALAFLIARRRRSRRELREWFGPEYERSVESSRSRRKAEGELAHRAERREAVDIRPLTQAAQARYAAQWHELQRSFVDRPQVAVVEADDLVTQVMRDRGYPVDDFEAQSALVSVDHPDVAQEYRDAHGIYTRTTSGEATTEDLRRAVMAYRTLFHRLIADGAPRADQDGPTRDRSSISDKG